MRIANRVYLMVLIIGLLALQFLLAWAADEKAAPLDIAEILVKEIKPELNAYSQTHNYIKWKGQDGCTNYESHCDCCGFMTLLLRHVYGYSAQDYRTLMGATFPSPIRYHDLITAGRNFDAIDKVQDLKPGDWLVIKYPPGLSAKGHVMLAAAIATRREAGKPIVDGSIQWELPVIDSTSSIHGPTDTRHVSNGSSGSGLGKGIFRLYTDVAGHVTGYTWSTSGEAEFQPQDQRHLVIGRFKLPSARQ